MTYEGNLIKSADRVDLQHVFRNHTFYIITIIAFVQNTDQSFQLSLYATFCGQRCYAIPQTCIVNPCLNKKYEVVPTILTMIRCIANKW